MQLGTRHFHEVVLADFEFLAQPGCRPLPVCLVARELVSGRQHRVWLNGDDTPASPPYPVGPETLFVAYYASAEVGCHLSLGWQPPAAVLDLFVEFRARTNGHPLPCGAGLLGALAFFGLDALAAAEKEEMRQLVLRGGPWTEEERLAILDYCATDVDALLRLLGAMQDQLDLPRALLRGEYMCAAASIEACGIPVDTEALARLRASWGAIQEELIRKIGGAFGCYNGRSFSAASFGDWLASRGIPWPRLDSGALALDDSTFREMARLHPVLQPLRELRHALGQLRLAEITVGPDGRNRTMLSAFRARTGRNQPSNTQSLFGTSKWLRGLIRPPPGHGLAYLDWKQQEFGIAAALSGDMRMKAAYESGDPYLAFAIQAGAAPAGATKESNAAVRSVFKQVALAVQYGMGPDSLALRLRVCPAEARELLALHHQTYAQFWRWSDAALDYAMLRGHLHTVFGWTTYDTSNPRSLRNFPMQANGAEMLRHACVLACRRGVRVCVPVHDAILIEAPLDQLDHAVALTREAMRQASLLVLGDFPLETDVKVVRAPDRYMDEGGQEMWNTVWSLVEGGPP